MFSVNRICAVVAVLLGMLNAACTPKPDQVDKPERVRTIAGAGDVQLIGLSPQWPSVAVKFVTDRTPSAGGTAESSITMYFGRETIGSNASEAKQAPREIVGRRFAADEVRVQFSDGPRNQTLYRPATPIFVSPDVPTIIDVRQLQAIPGSTTRPSFWEMGAIPPVVR